jgi:hypothetical protein
MLVELKFLKVSTYDHNNIYKYTLYERHFFKEEDLLVLADITELYTLFISLQ